MISSSTPSAANAGSNARQPAPCGPAGGLLGVHPVDRGLVRLAPGPEGQRRRRGQERPAVQVRRRLRQGADQRGMTLAEPAGQFGIAGPLAENLLLGRAARRAGEPAG